MTSGHPGREWTDRLVVMLVMEMLLAGWVFAAECPPKDGHLYLSSCPCRCTCASDLLSCSKVNLSAVPDNLPATSSSIDLSHNFISLLPDRWLSSVPNLYVLRLSHNKFRSLSAGAFHNGSELRHLDLSSNQLQAIQRESFQALLMLEELLLYNNLISAVEAATFSRLSNIQKIYLSWNNLSSFTFSTLQKLSTPRLRTLDLSANSFVELPMEEVSSLPAFIKNGLYLHNNPLTCNCPLYLLLSHWQRRGFSSVLDFSREHTCLYMGKRRAVVRILASHSAFHNCSAEHAAPEAAIRVLVGKRLWVSCNSNLPQDNTTYLWISPAYDFIFPPGNRSLRIHPNGTLEIRAAQAWHSGVYLCIAFNRRLSYNTSHEVNVMVHFPKPAETFNTALTTLLGCVVTLLLVFIYLYMTPCRCAHRCCCSKSAPPTPSPPPLESSAQSSILCGTPPASDGPNNNRKGGASRHVVFLEPVKERRKREKPKIAQRRTDSASSVFSDCPIVQI